MRLTSVQVAAAVAVAALALGAPPALAGSGRGPLTLTPTLGAPPALTASGRGPLTVEPTLSSKVARATIGETGGTLRLRTSTGARVTLVIPARSLAQDTPITMTAVSRLRGLPFTHEPVARVALGPEGVTLLRGATLTVTTKRPLPSGRRAAVAWLGTGQDAHLYPTARSTKIKLVLTHFSGYAVGEATPAEQGALAAHTPADQVARTEGTLARLLHQYADPSSPEFEDALAEWALREYRVAAALLKSAETDDTVHDQAMRRSMAVERALALLGIGEGVGQWTPPPTRDERVARELKKLAASMRRSWPLAWSNLYRQAKSRCVNDHQPGQAERIFGIARARALLDLEADNVDATLRDFYRCARYTLEVTISFTDDAFELRRADCQDPLYGDQAVAVWGSAVTTPPAEVAGILTGTGSLMAETADYGIPGEAECGPGSIWRDPVTYTILTNRPGKLSFQPSVVSHQVGVQMLGTHVNAVMLTVWAPLIQMQGQWDDVITATPFNAFFGDAWRVAHENEAAPGPSGRTDYYFGRWVDGSGDVLGAVTLDRDIPYGETDAVGHLTGSGPSYSSTGTLHELTTLTLRHTPDPSLASDN